MLTCYAIRPRLEAYLDGELQPVSMLDVDCHLAQCPSCTQRVLFERTLRAGLKRATWGDRSVPVALGRRIGKALIAERTPLASSCSPMRGQAPGADPVAARLWRGWYVALPATAIVLMVLHWGIVATPRTQVLSATMPDLRLSQLDHVLDMMTARHLGAQNQGAARLPGNLLVDTALVSPPRLPPLFAPYSLHPAPGMQFASRPAALLGESAHYAIEGHRVTFFVYRARTTPLRARLAGRVIDGQVVYIGSHQGYSIATMELGSVGWAVTSDLPSAQNARLILAAVSNTLNH